jgi:hypothetical protein
MGGISGTQTNSKRIRQSWPFMEDPAAKLQVRLCHGSGSCWTLTIEVQVCARVSPCRIWGGQRGTEAGFCPSSSVFPCQYHSTMALHPHISYGGWITGLLIAAVQRHSVTPSAWIWTTLPIQLHSQQKQRALTAFWNLGLQLNIAFPQITKIINPTPEQ